MTTFAHKGSQYVSQSPRCPVPDEACIRDHSDSWESAVSAKFFDWKDWLCFVVGRLKSGFTPDFWILAGYLNKLWADFDEILWVDSCGGLYTQLYSPQFDYVLSRMRQSPDTIDMSCTRVLVWSSVSPSNRSRIICRARCIGVSVCDFFLYTRSFTDPSPRRTRTVSKNEICFWLKGLTLLCCWTSYLDCS